MAQHCLHRIGQRTEEANFPFVDQLSQRLAAVGLHLHAMGTRALGTEEAFFFRYQQRQKSHGWIGQRDEHGNYLTFICLVARKRPPKVIASMIKINMTPNAAAWRKSPASQWDQMRNDTTLFEVELSMSAIDNSRIA